MRLDKYIAETLQMTRSEARIAIQRGRISLDGTVCKKADTQVKPEMDVKADGLPLTHEEFVYLMLNKPLGVVSAAQDKRDVTVVDLVQKSYPRRQLFPAGRLDKASTGFILLTDDGGFAHDILAPKHHVSKSYLVKLDTPFTPEMAAGFAAGVTLADGQTMDAAEAFPADPADPTLVRVVIHQGVYHQIKRMFGVFDAGVDALHREAIGGLSLDPSLEPGQWRPLTQAEVATISTK